MSLADSQRTFGVKRKTLRALKSITCRVLSYPEPGSNRHGLLHWCLRPARLPIPPSGLGVLGVWAPPTITEVVDLLVEGCKDIANCGKLQQVGA